MKDNVPILGQPKMICTYCGGACDKTSKPYFAYQDIKIRSEENKAGLIVVCFLCAIIAIHKSFTGDDLVKPEIVEPPDLEVN